MTHRLLVDAMNVIGARPTGWWRDRDAAVRSLVTRLERLADVTGEAITVVVDGWPIGGLPEDASGPVAVCYARRSGPDAADDRIVELVAGLQSPRAVTVVTSDRELRRRVNALGGDVTGVSALWRRLDAVAPQPATRRGPGG